MHPVQEILSAEGLFRLTVFRRDDGTYGFIELRNLGDAHFPQWREERVPSSRFESLETALGEARGRIAWLKRESEWPAREKAPQAVAEHAPGWIECPFCGKSFSLQDQLRWGGGRHLTCGQRIDPATPIP